MDDGPHGTEVPVGVLDFADGVQGTLWSRFNETVLSDIYG
jgi:hypothetical protein